MPWINWKGASVGSVVGFIIGVWIGIGQIVIKNHLEVLPTTITNCTDINSTDYYTMTTAMPPHSSTTDLYTSNITMSSLEKDTTQYV